MKRCLMLTLVLLGILVALGPTGEAHAQEALSEGSSSLDEQPAVRRQLLLREGRAELQPTFGFSVLDTFQSNLLVGLNASYHFTNSFGVAGGFHYGITQIGTDILDTVTSSSFENQDVKDSLNVTHLQFAADLGVTLVPIAGRMSIFRNNISYDVHLFAGGAALSFVSECADSGARDCRDIEDAGGFSPGAALGGGARVYINNFVAFSFEFRDYLVSYSEFSRSATEDNSAFRNFFTVHFGVSLFLPTDVYISR